MMSERSKRPVSPSNLNVTHKKHKFVNDLIGFFKPHSTNGNNNNNMNGVVDADISMMSNVSSSMASFNRFRSENLGNRNISDITALKLYHESLKKQNNDRYSELLGETTPYEPISGGDSMRDDQTFSNDSNNTVIKYEIRGKKRPFKESRDSSFVIPNAQQRKQSIPNLRQQLSRINPRERSNLINLKRKMKLDAYYKRRMNYLNYYNQNNMDSNNSSMNVSMNSSFQPRKQDLSSTKKLKNLDSHVDKKSKVTNTLGVFNGSFMYDLDEEDDVKDETNNTIGYKPINIDLKSEKINKYGPKTLVPGMETVLDGQKKAIKTLEKKVTFDLKKNISQEPVKQNIVGPTSSFTFVNNNTAEASEPKLTVIAPVVQNGAKTDSDKPGFSFGAQPDSAPTSSFSFSLDTNGSSLKESSSASLLGNAQKSNDKPDSGSLFGNSEKPTSFSFGGNAKLDSAKTDTKISETKLLSADQAAKPAFSFGSSADKPSEPVSKPTFSFGAAAKEDKPAEPVSKPAFSFGTSTQDKPVDLPAKPAFSFSAGNDDKPVECATKPAFSFGSQDKPAEVAKPAFSFGGQDKPAETTTKPTFSFGASSQDKPAETALKPAFSFSKPLELPAATIGGETVIKPAFSFGTGEKKDDTSKPLFNNGSTEPPKSMFGSDSTLPKPLFSFGDSSKLFSFGEGDTKKRSLDDSSSSNTKKPEISIMNQDSNKIESPKPTPLFSFGNNKPSAFSFTAGHSGTPSVSSDNGNAAAANKPVFNFGAGASGFSTNTAVSSKESTPLIVPDAKKFNFGNATKPAFPATSSGTTTPVSTTTQPLALPVPLFQFNPGSVGGLKLDPSSVFGAASSQSLGFNFNPSRSATPGNFNFNGSATTVNPANVFGQQVTPDSASSTPVFGGSAPVIGQPGNMFGVNGANMNGNMFGGFNPQSTAMTFGAGQPAQQQPMQQQLMFATSMPATPGTGTPIPGRKLARMRQPRSHR